MINFMASRRGFTKDDSKCMPPLSDDSDPKNGGSSGRGEDLDDSDEHNQLGIRLDAEAEKPPDGLSGVVIEKEHMFDKVVTPSDVGKLNRLVIPKQQAEKYFPLDFSTNEKGLLLNFEDRLGKPWRFRYSYWTSSQSYVMTKGWSRFVKEKKLDAGDIVSFQRGIGELFKDCFFIDWRRRPDAPLPFSSLASHFTFRTWNHPLFLPSGPQYCNVNGGYGYGNPNSIGSFSVVEREQRQGWVEGMGMSMSMPTPTPTPIPIPPVVFQSVPVFQGKAPAKRLRLFGVNMECSISESESSSATISPMVRMNTRSQNQNKTFDLSFSSIPSLALRPDRSNDGINKGKASMSLDFDI